MKSLKSFKWIALSFSALALVSCGTLPEKKKGPVSDNTPLSWGGRPGPTEVRGGAFGGFGR